MKKLLFWMLFTTAAVAQVSPPSTQSRVAGRFVAYNYGTWQVQVYKAPAGTGSQTFSVASSQVRLTDGRTFMPFSTNSPIFVGKEQVTPSAVGAGCINAQTAQGSCVLTATFSQLHTVADYVQPATYGLQEALNDAGNSGGGAVVIDTAWTGLGGTTTIKNAATLPSNTGVEDTRTGSPVPSGVITGSLTPNKIPLAATSSTLADSHLDDGLTTAATVTSSEPLAIGGSGGISSPQLTVNGSVGAAINIVSALGGGNKAANVNLWNGATQEWFFGKNASQGFQIGDTVNGINMLLATQNGITNLNSGNGANTICFNCTVNAGTSGIEVDSGGASPAKVAGIDGAGNGVFNGAVSVALASNSASGTVAASTTIAPTTPLVLTTGTTAIATITLPPNFTTGCFDMIPASTVATTTAGNIQAIYSLTANTLFRACYSGTKWFFK